MGNYPTDFPITDRIIDEEAYPGFIPGGRGELNFIGIFFIIRSEESRGGAPATTPSLCHSPALPSRVVNYAGTWGYIDGQPKKKKMKGKGSRKNKDFFKSMAGPIRPPPLELNGRLNFKFRKPEVQKVIFSLMACPLSLPPLNGPAIKKILPLRLPYWDYENKILVEMSNGLKILVGGGRG